MGKLSSKERKALPKSQFAVPSKAPGSGSYPIPDASHARNALARVSQFGSPAQKSAVRAKVSKAYPGIGQKDKYLGRHDNCEYHEKKMGKALGMGSAE